ncbi:MAG TPA: replicative DNA helicase [Rhodospirillaceae bacterium]|jgi:replicative DNA helicase|nr:replicative DNA helicase [Alphaproteobacteria bacterium]HBH27133.1 replicative DNA helicase [Rhodospirillaceae bacterium]
MTAAAAVRQAQAPEPRALPHNMEAEQALLGALLLDNRALERMGDFLRAEHFFVPAHGRIYDAIVKVCERGQVATPVTLKDFFAGDADLAGVGGPAYLAELADGVVSIAAAKDYARAVYDLALRRALVTIGEEVVHDAYAPAPDRAATDAIEAAEAKLFTLAEQGQITGGFVTLRDSVLSAIRQAERAYQTDGHVTGITTGLLDMDKKLGGLQKSDLLILAGRPSMGKTALATNIAFNAAQKYAESGGKEGAVVGFFSLEMSADQLAARVLADQSGVSADAIRKGTIRQDDFRAFVEASQRLASTPLYIDDTPALTIGAVRTRARRLKRQHGLGLLVIDYLQLLTGTGSRQALDNRVQEVAEITRGLKAIAKELEIPVLALSQLSRQVESREDKRPQLSDLRESGTIEQDADVVMFIYREEYYLSRAMPEEGTDKHMKWQEKMGSVHNVAEAIIAKQRHGPIGTVRLFFDGNLTRFSDLEQGHPSQR